MLLSLRKNGLTSLFKEVRVFKVFFGKLQGKPQKKNKDFYPCRTPKIPRKEGKNAQKNKEFLAGEEKSKEFQKKTRKGRTGHLPNPYFLVGASEGLGLKISSEIEKINLVGVSRGNTIRGNRTERFWEGNLPLRGSLRGSLFSEVLRGFQRVWEVFRGFQRFSEVFQRPSQRPSQSPFSSQSCGSCCP